MMRYYRRMGQEDYVGHENMRLYGSPELRRAVYFNGSVSRSLLYGEQLFDPARINKVPIDIIHFFFRMPSMLIGQSKQGARVWSVD